VCSRLYYLVSSKYSLRQRFPNFFQVGTTFISQNVLRTTLLLSPFESKLFKIFNYSVWYAVHVNLIFSVFFGLMFSLKRTTRAEPEDHLWSADHRLGNAVLDKKAISIIELVHCVGYHTSILPDARSTKCKIYVEGKCWFFPIVSSSCQPWRDVTFTFSCNVHLYALLVCFVTSLVTE
jgi:hypothetical protein